MKLKDILSPHFCNPAKPLTPLIQVAYDSDFCQDTVTRGVLTADQMHHAADRYRLGKSRSGKTIYWMIDELGIVRDGHIGNSWVSQLLKSREPHFLHFWHPTPCLFGLHLLCPTDPTDHTDYYKTHTETQSFTEGGNEKSVGSVCDKTICVVESEASAVILSELLPKSLWLAYCDISSLTVDLLEPLQNHIVTIYPRTDPTMSNDLFFRDYANAVRQTYPSVHLTIDDTLEKNASPAQKSRCIDLLDFILE